jgi:hypothetical protein
MTANDSLERGIADVYEREAPTRAPDWVLTSVLDAVETTPQRRVLIPAPWRFRHMNTFAKAAIAAVVVVAIGAVGLTMLGPRSPSGVGGQPTASPSISPSPTPTFGATIVPEPAPPLSQTFTSERHGFSMSYPAGWDATPASAPWTTPAQPDFGMPDGDFVFDRALRDHLFVGAVSRPLAAGEVEQWAVDRLNAMASADECELPLEPITIDGSAGQLCGSIAATSAGDRGYLFALYRSGDDPSAVAVYDDAFFRSVLATVQLTPETANDSPASPSASPSS